jgi:hypothetical protein
MEPNFQDFLAPTGELYKLLCHRGLVLVVLLRRENSHFLQ